MQTALKALKVTDPYYLWVASVNWSSICNTKKVYQQQMQRCMFTRPGLVLDAVEMTRSGIFCRTIFEGWLGLE